MKTAADVILALEGTSKRNVKEDIIEKAWNAGIFEFFDGARLAFDVLVTFGVKKVPLIEDDDGSSSASNFNWTRFIAIANQLRNRTLTGNAARDTLRSAADIADVKEWNGFYRRVLLKDFKCGCSESTINKVLIKISKAGDKSASKYIIPVFSCQLAKNGNDHPKKLKGPKLLDIKLDGVRLLTLVDINKKEVIQYTRNGLINDNFPHIRKMFEVFIPLLKESMVFDGEIVSQNFQDMMTQLNRKSNLNTTDAKLALFDIIPWASFKNGEWRVSQVDRHDALCAFEGVFSKKMGDTVYIIPKLAVDLDTESGQKAFKEFNNDAVKAGFEGIMIKDPTAYYITDRTDSWLKIKPKITVDLTVTGFEPGKVGGENEHSLGGMICEGVEDGKNIKVVVGNGYSDELRNDIWNNKSKVKGRIVEVEGDVITKSRDSDTWSLRFPVFSRFRGWKPGEKL